MKSQSSVTWNTRSRKYNMHYIPGVSFDVPPSSRGKTDKESLLRNRYINQFPHPGSWELFYIRRKPTGEVVYQFKSHNTYEIHSINFSNTGDGDKLISVMLGEKLPDYEDVYINMSD